MENHSRGLLCYEFFVLNRLTVQIYFEFIPGALKVPSAHVFAPFLISPRRFFALTSLRLLFLLASGLALLVCVDTWRNKIWPQIRGAPSCFLWRLLIANTLLRALNLSFSFPPVNVSVEVNLVCQQSTALHCGLCK